MNCYICFMERGSISRSALAVCQHCGAGMCDEHLVMLTTRLSGMAGSRKRSLICSQCSHLTNSESCTQLRTIDQQPEHKGKRPLWETWLRPSKREILPEPESVLAEVERILKRQKE